MDFQKALAVLQARAATSELPKSSGDNTTASTLPACSPCDGEAQKLQAGDADLPEDLSQLAVGALLRLFLDHQESRVAVYRRFEDGFNLFLQVAEAKGYEALVASTTASFSAVSAQVNRVEAELRRRGGEALPLATLLRSVQQLEKDKLQVTAQLQILRHGLKVDEIHQESDDDAAAAAAARTFALRSDEAAGLSGRLAELTSQLNEALDEVRAELADAADLDGEPMAADVS